MLQAIVTTFINVVLILNFIYSGCCFAGKIIYTTIWNVYKLICSFSLIVAKSFKAILEGLNIFIQDIYIYSENVFGFLNECINAVAKCLHYIQYFIITAKTFFSSIQFEGSRIFKVKDIILDRIVWLSESIYDSMILIGDIIYKILKIIPNFLAYLYCFIHNFIGSIPYYVVSFKQFTYYKIEKIPIQFLLGITFICLVIILRKLVYKCFKLMILYFWTKILENVGFLPNLMSREIFSARRLMAQNTETHQYRNRTQNKNREGRIDNPDIMCIICQEEHKSIVLLPCKHLCMCVNCSNSLHLYQEVCPLCRSLVTNKMKVYM